MTDRPGKSVAQRGLAAEVLARCDEIALFSEEVDKITRTFLSEPMHRLHALMTQWMHEAGLTIRVDEAGNLIGRYEGLRPHCPVLAMGSHLDTVPDAGKYDGVLGVVLALAAVKGLSGSRLPFGIDVIGFSEEEGVRFAAPFLGSLAASGRFDRRLLERTDASGITMAEAFRSFGLDPGSIDRAAYPNGVLIGYLEVHIEQGPVLDSLMAPAGVVEAIAGQSRIRAEFRGRAGHAGTTPMEGRHDALTATAELVLKIEHLARSIDGVRATVGALDVEPGASNVIPGRAKFSIDVRHHQDEVRTLAVDKILTEAVALADSRGVEFRATQVEHYSAVPADPALSQWLADAMAASGHHPHRLISGAGHDAAVMARIAPMAMLFLRSPGGVSHHPDERVLLEDVAIGLDVLIKYLNILASRIQRDGRTFLGLRNAGIA